MMNTSDSLRVDTVLLYRLSLSEVTIIDGLPWNSSLSGLLDLQVRSTRIAKQERFPGLSVCDGSEYKCYYSVCMLYHVICTILYALM